MLMAAKNELGEKDVIQQDMIFNDIKHIHYSFPDCLVKCRARRLDTRKI